MVTWVIKFVPSIDTKNTWIERKWIFISDVFKLNNEGWQPERGRGGEGDTVHKSVVKLFVFSSGETDQEPEEECEAPDGGERDQEDCPCGVQQCERCVQLCG